MVSNVIVKSIPVGKELKLQLLEIPGVNNVMINPQENDVDVGISHTNTDEEIVQIAQEILKGIN